jgi:hypothetical protein
MGWLILNRKPIPLQVLIIMKQKYPTEKEHLEHYQKVANYLATEDLSTSTLCSK